MTSPQSTALTQNRQMVSGWCASVISTEFSKNSLNYILLMGHYENHFGNIQKLQEWETARTNRPYSQMAGSPVDSQGVKVHLSMMGFIGWGTNSLMTLHPPSMRSWCLSTQCLTQQIRTPSPKMIFSIITVDSWMSLLLRNFMDAIKEGDGERIIRCIKMFLLHFKVDGGGSTKCYGTRVP